MSWSWPEIQKFIVVTSKASPPFLQSGIRIILIIIAGYVGVRIVSFLLQQKERFLIAAREPTETVPGTIKKRMKTITGILTTIARSAIWTVVFITALDQMGINIAPLITGAGIMGIAIGFGAQTLVQDFISGFFMLMEDQISVGDEAILNGTKGWVEAITFRTVVLRDVAGVVHVFRNGTITTLSNMTKVWSAYILDIGVSYKENTDRVIEVMKQVAEEMRQEPAYQKKMIAPLEVFGIDSFDTFGVTIKARLKTVPTEQWNMGREYRRRLKMAFATQGIEIPFPHHSIHFSDATKPLEVIVKQTTK
jgi:small conductance mechanosensitive channel